MVNKYSFNLQGDYELSTFSYRKQKILSFDKLSIDLGQIFEKYAHNSNCDIYFGEKKSSHDG